MKKIKLTQNKYAIVDDEDYERLIIFKWHTLKSRGKLYAVKQNSKINNLQKRILMHRDIITVPKDMQLDHINGNGLDNRKENLRICIHQQNQQNQLNPHKNNKLGIKGVHWNKKRRKFVAQIRFNGKKLNLGCFNVLGDADSAYRMAEEKYFGKFARKYNY